jgi:hypothetical protein
VTSIFRSSCKDLLAGSFFYLFFKYHLRIDLKVFSKIEPPQGVDVTAPRQTARPRHDNHASHRQIRQTAATKRVSFSDPLVTPPSQQEQPRIHLGTVFLLPREEGFCMPRAGSSFAASTKEVSITPAETA